MQRTQRFKRVTKPKKPIQPSDPNNDTTRSKSLTIRAKPKPQPTFHSIPTSDLSSQQMTILGPEFFQMDALDLAPRLLGKFLKKDDVVLQITEVEAYRPNDSACHGRFGITTRTAPVFGPGGHAYVYLCYGLHTMLNVVADKEGVGAAVLIRSCAPVSGNPELFGKKTCITSLKGIFPESLIGLKTIQQRRSQKTEKPVLLTGPGKVGQALGISTEWSNHPLYTPGGLELLDGPEPEMILIGPRVGIEYALPEHVNALWRFAIAGSPWISAPKNTFKANMILTSRKQRIPSGEIGVENPKKWIEESKENKGEM